MRNILFLVFFITSCLSETAESKNLKELKDIQKTLKQMKKDIDVVKESYLDFGNIQLTRINRLEQLKEIVKESDKIEKIYDKLKAILEEEQTKEKN